MTEKKKIKDTKLGAWLSEKAPSILGVVGDLLPDSGALGVVKNLIDKDDSVDSEEAQRVIDAEVRFQENVTERWKADMGSNVKDSYVDLLQILMMTAFGAYFAGRTIEKSKK